MGPSNGSGRRLTLVFVVTRAWPSLGGIESFLRHLTRELGTRHEVTVVAQRIDAGTGDRLSDSLRAPPPFEAFEDGPVHVQPLRIAPHRRLLLAPHAAAVVPILARHAYGRMRLPLSSLYARVVAPEIRQAAGQADVLHVFGGDLLGAAALHAGRALGAPVVMTPFAHRGQWGDDPAAAATYRRADRVVGLLESDARLYRELGVPAERISVSGNCSPGVPAGGGEAVRGSSGISGTLVLFLGVRRAYKGFDALLRAAAIVERVRPDVSFAFVGPGPPIAPGTGQANVIDVGAVDDAGRAGWLEAADLLCLPSEGEIFPGAFLEAWSVGTPVLGSDIPPLIELIGRAGGGATAPREPQGLANAILALVADPDRLRALGAAGRAFWERHATVPAVAVWHEELYAELLEAWTRGWVHGSQQKG